MPSLRNDPKAQADDSPSTGDIVGGVLVLLLFLVPAFLAATYLHHATRMLSDLVQEVAHATLLWGVGWC